MQTAAPIKNIGIRKPRASNSEFAMKMMNSRDPGRLPGEGEHNQARMKRKIPIPMTAYCTVFAHFRL